MKHPSYFRHARGE